MSIANHQLLPLRDKLDECYYREHLTEGRIVIYSDDNFTLDDAKSFINHIKYPPPTPQFSPSERRMIREKLGLLK
jgi:hypothetical protein